MKNLNESVHCRMLSDTLNEVWPICGLTGKMCTARNCTDAILNTQVSVKNVDTDQTFDVSIDEIDLTAVDKLIFTMKMSNGQTVQAIAPVMVENEDDLFFNNSLYRQKAIYDLFVETPVVIESGESARLRKYGAVRGETISVNIRLHVFVNAPRHACRVVTASVQNFSIENGDRAEHMCIEQISVSEITFDVAEEALVARNDHSVGHFVDESFDYEDAPTSYVPDEEAFIGEDEIASLLNGDETGSESDDTPRVTELLDVDDIMNDGDRVNTKKREPLSVRVKRTVDAENHSNAARRE